MKTKIYLFRLTVGLTAFLFSLGVFAIWKYRRTAAPPQAEIIQPDLKNFHDFTSAATIEEKPDCSNADVKKDDEAAKFDAEGFYYIADKTPKGFENFEHFNITNKNYRTENEDEYGKPIAPGGFVLTKKEFKFTKISIGGEQIQFETERLKGISYSFTGRFIETRNFVYLEPEETEKVVEGKFIKRRNGVKIAESEVKLGWFAELGCGC
ncbi:MAG: hypothetical protein LH472_02350 [Pyrinomonadaceae bacterium]|nr:hypothetical protein [Pyrinomonadaceae bacterium]